MRPQLGVADRRWGWLTRVIGQTSYDRRVKHEPLAQPIRLPQLKQPPQLVGGLGSLGPEELRQVSHAARGQRGQQARHGLGAQAQPSQLLLNLRGQMGRRAGGRVREKE